MLKAYKHNKNLKNVKLLQLLTGIL